MLRQLFLRFLVPYLIINAHIGYSFYVHCVRSPEYST